MRLVATIRHNDPRRPDRVALFVDARGRVFALAVDDLDPVDTGVDLERLSTAWGGVAWDLREVDDLEAFRWAAREQGFAGDLDAWRRLAPRERLDYELGAAGFPTV